jgi:hypothetical protein
MKGGKPSRRQHNFMEMVAHNPAAAKRVGVPQRVGKEFVAADKAAGLFKGKAPPMAAKKHNTDGISTEHGMSPRKAMASGASGGGNFGVEPFHEAQGHSGDHPDHVAQTGHHGAMADHERAIGHPIHHTKHHHPAQAAPDHGPHHVDGHMNHHAEGHKNDHAQRAAHHKAMGDHHHAAAAHHRKHA